MITLTVAECSDKYGFEPITLPDGARDIDGCYIGDLLSWVMGRAKSGNVWITIMSNINIVAVATLADVSCVILAEGVTIDDDVKSAASAKGINILSSSLTAYETAVAVSNGL